MTRYTRYVSKNGNKCDIDADVPAHWQVSRNKALFYLNRRIVGSDSTGLQLLSLTLKGVVKRDKDSGVGKMPASFDSYQRVEQNELIFCLFDIDETPRTIGLSPHEGMITGAYDVFSLRPGVSAEFIYYYYHHVDSFKGLRPFYTGLRKAVRMDTFLNIKIPSPPEAEQKTIAAFLDYETAKIDQLIAKQQRLITLLKEKRQAVISHAVTKGLNPNAPMKDSGVEWLGEVPEHWAVSKVRNYAHVFIPQRNKPSLSSSGMPWVTMTEIGEPKVSQSKLFVSSAAAALADSKELPPNSVIASCVGTFAVASINIDPVIINQQLQAYICGSKLCPEYLRFLVCVSEAYFKAVATAATLEYVNKEGFGNMPIPHPSVEEQKDIVAFLDKKLERIDGLEQRSAQQVMLFKERRSALISAAVTGKIDVRGWVAPAALNTQ